MSSNCNHNGCKRRWKRAFGKTQKNCDNFNPPKLHLVPEVNQEKRRGIEHSDAMEVEERDEEENDMDHNDSKMRTGAAKIQRRRQVHKPVCSANDM